MVETRWRRDHHARQLEHADRSGQAQIVVSAPGYIDWTTTVEVAEQATSAIDIPLLG
jgi:hypothetical protein